MVDRDRSFPITGDKTVVAKARRDTPREEALPGFVEPRECLGKDGMARGITVSPVHKASPSTFKLGVRKSMETCSRDKATLEFVLTEMWNQDHTEEIGSSPEA